jgi:hypothetical protein
VPDSFIGLSRNSLQDAKLARLNKLSNLRKASRQHREALGEIRSEIAAAHHELTLIEQQLERVVAFPKQQFPAAPEAKVKVLPEVVPARAMKSA